MGKRILIIQGHPDASAQHFCHALSDAYVRGARSAGHEVKTIAVAELDFPMLRSQRDWEQELVPASLATAQSAIWNTDHLVLFFPLWMGSMPALLKGFLEQVLRPGFAVPRRGSDTPSKPLRGRSGRVVVTMGMPEAIFRWYFAAHGLKALERNVLKLVGIGPIRDTVIGSVEAMSESRRATCLERLERLGRTAS